MERILNTSTVAPIAAPVLPHIAASTPTRSASAETGRATASGARQVVASRPVSVTAIWRGALSALSAHSAAILFFALVGFALPTIIGNWLDTSAKLSAYVRTRAIVTLYDKPSLSTLLIQASLGVLALTFARGAITWLALHGKGRSEDDKARGSFGAACRTTLASYPALLVGTLLYGVVITAEIVALSELTRGLEFIPNKMAHIWAGPHRAFGDMLRQLSWQSINALLPNPGSPFAEFIPHGSYRDLQQVSLLLPLFIVIIVETLLRFRTVAVMARCDGNVVAPLAYSVGKGVRHFRVITLHVWLMRLALFALTVALVEFPVAMVDQFIVPNVMRLGGSFEVLPMLRFMATVSAALVNAILLALSVVYDARLYAVLERYITSASAYSTALSSVIARPSAQAAAKVSSPN